MTVSTADPLAPLRRPRAALARSAAAVVGSGATWEALRGPLAREISTEPRRAAAWLEALVEALRASPSVPDRALAGRLTLYEGHAVHRTGSPAKAAALYADAARRLTRARLGGEALLAAVTRVDALATAGRVEEALALGRRLAPRVRGPALRRQGAALDVHVGNALRLAGRADEARRRYQRAAAALESMGLADRALAVRLNDAVAGVEAGDAEDGRAALDAVAAECAARGLDDLAMEARENAAWARLHCGDVGGAVVALAAAAEEHRKAGLVRREAVCRMDLAEALRRAGDLSGAEREAAKAARTFEAEGAEAEQAEARLVAAAASPDARRSAQHRREARRLARKSDRAALLVRAELAAADEALRAGRRPADLGRLQREARATGHRPLLSEASLLCGAAAAAAGRPAVAATHWRLAASTASGRPWLRWAAAAGLASLDARGGAGIGRALTRLDRVAASMSAVREALPGAWLRARFAEEHLDPWLTRVELLLRRGRRDDRRRALALLAERASLRRLGASPPTSGKARRAVARLSAIYDRLARGDDRGASTPYAPSDADGTARLGARARRWEQALVSAWASAERTRSTACSSPPPPVAHGRETEVYLWRRGPRVEALVAVDGEPGALVDLGDATALESIATALSMRGRASLPSAPAVATTSDPVEDLLSDLAERWLARLDVGAWSPVVAIVADPGLPDLPWELLPLRGERLGERHAVGRVLGRWPTAVRAAGRTAGRGTAVFGVSEPGLAHVDHEVAEVARITGADDVRTGSRATRAALADALACAEVVHVAGHGWDGGEAPPMAGLRLSDGWFGWADLPSRVNARCVVLTACRTGRATGQAAPAWGGLVATLLMRGAGEVIAADDDVGDEAAARFGCAYHARRVRGEACAFGAALADVARAVGSPGPAIPFRRSIRPCDPAPDPAEQPKERLS